MESIAINRSAAHRGRREGRGGFGGDVRRRHNMGGPLGGERTNGAEVEVKIGSFSRMDG